MVPAVAPLDFNTDPLGSVLLIVLLILSLGVHEAAHAWSAWKCGDPTAKDLGRMTLNPIVHVDIWMTIVIPAICILAGAPVFGGAKPVPVNPNRLRKPWTDMAVVALAGPFSNLLLAVLFFALARFFAKTGYYNGASETFGLRLDDMLPRVLYGTSFVNVALFVFNLLPIPPLDGSRVVVLGLPATLRETYLGIGRYGLFIILGLLNFVPAFQHTYFAARNMTIHLVERVATLGGAW